MTESYRGSLSCTGRASARPSKKEKRCFVPLCGNTSKKTPSKLLLGVPKDVKRRKTWLKSARRDKVPLARRLYCCEDHFNLEEDMEDYLRYRMVGGTLKPKAHVVPHIFSCQPNRPTAKFVERRAFQKRNNMRLISDAMADTSSFCPVPTKSTIKPADIAPNILSISKDSIDPSASTNKPEAAPPLLPGPFRGPGVQVLLLNILGKPGQRLIAFRTTSLPGQAGASPKSAEPPRTLQQDFLQDSRPETEPSSIAENQVKQETIFEDRIKTETLSTGDNQVEQDFSCEDKTKTESLLTTGQVEQHLFCRDKIKTEPLSTVEHQFEQIYLCDDKPKPDLPSIELSQVEQVFPCEDGVKTELTSSVNNQFEQVYLCESRPKTQLVADKKPTTTLKQISALQHRKDGKSSKPVRPRDYQTKCGKKVISMARAQGANALEQGKVRKQVGLLSSQNKVGTYAMPVMQAILQGGKTGCKKNARSFSQNVSAGGSVDNQSGNIKARCKKHKIFEPVFEPFRDPIRGSFECSMCSERFRTGVALNKHLFHVACVDHVNRKARCKKNFKFEQVSEPLQDPIRGSFECCMCSGQFRTGNALNKHLIHVACVDHVLIDVPASASLAKAELSH